MRAMTKSEQYIRIWEEYRKAHDNHPATTMQMIEWARVEGLYEVDQRAALRRGAEELAAALRSQTVAANDGEATRINMPFVDDENGWLWDDLRTIRHDRMEIGFAHGRNRVVGELKSMARQAIFYMDYHQDRPPLQISFDFTNDMLDAGINLPSSSAPRPPVAQPPVAPRARRLRLVPSRPV